MDSNLQPEKYAVVHFQQDGSYSEIPSIWLHSDNKKCFWSPVKQASKYIKDYVTPTKHWLSFDIEVELFCDSLEKARRKAEDNTYTTDEETGPGKRRKTVPPDDDYNGDYSSESETSDGRRRTVLKKLPPAPKTRNVNRQKAQYQSSQTVQGNGGVGVFTVTPTTPYSTSPGECSSSLASIQSMAPLIIDETTPVFIEQLVEEAPPIHVQILNKCNDIPFAPEVPEEIYEEIPNIGTPPANNNNDALNSASLKNIMSLLSKVDCKLDDLLLTNRQPPKIEKFAKIANKLPIKSSEEFEEFENTFLSQEENKKLLHGFLIKIGGNGIKDMVCRICSKLFTNRFATLCSFCGLRNNFRIKGRSLTNYISDVVLGLTGGTESEFDTIIAEWFRQAGQRLKRERQN